MSVPTNWSGAGNGETGGYWGIYHQTLDHGHTVHFNPSYHGLVFDGGVEYGNAPIQAMVGAACHGYNIGEGIHVGDGGDGGGRIGVGGRVG